MQFIFHKIRGKRGRKTENSGRRHRKLIVKQACDILEPDIPRSGGPIEIRRIAEMADM